jgi:Domain of unknown function (DUF4114)
MKPSLLAAVLLLFLASCNKDKIDELPTDISKLQPIQHLADTLKTVLSENGNAVSNNPVLFSDTIQKNIILTKASRVFVTFIDEETSKKNTLGWYMYPYSKPPASTSDVDAKILFPNISKVGEGGLLESGFTVQLGTETFPAGTVIGFFIVANGWDNGTVNLDRPIYFTNYNLNPNGDQLHVLFKNEYSNYIVVGFEDNLSPGRDFNDLLFAVSDNNEGLESTSFDLSNMFIR